MFNIWAERIFPDAYLPWLGETVKLVGCGGHTPEDPFFKLTDAHAIVASAQYRYDGSVMDRSPNLCVISRTGIGYDLIEVEAATERGIVVCNAPDGPTISTAELTITLMMSVAKNIKPVENLFHQAKTKDYFSIYNGIELNGLNLGLVGLGRIGSHVAQIAQALGMKVFGYDPYLSSDQFRAKHIEPHDSLESLLKTSDVISLHVPHSEQTHHMINTESLSWMNQGTILINAARGGLVDEQALLNALDAGHLHGVGLDVLSKEPIDLDEHHPFLNREDVVVTPHIAAATRAGKDRLWEMAIKQILQVLHDEKPDNVVNPEVWDKRRMPATMS